MTFESDVDKLYEYLRTTFEERIVVLDGGMGTQIQTYKLQEEDYRGTQFVNVEKLVKNNNDLLNITQPSLVTDIH